MYAHRSTKRLNGLVVEIELPAEFADCEEAEIIVLPLARRPATADDWATRVRRLAGTLGDDFPDDIDEADLPADTARALDEAFE
jgi:hypothetical protein